MQELLGLVREGKVNCVIVKDFPKKITGAKREKIRRGKAVSKSCVYGYPLDCKRNMASNPVAADTVRFIFQMYSEGKSLTDVEKLIYEAGIPTPAAYKKQKRAAAQDERFACVWQKFV